MISLLPEHYLSESVREYIEQTYYARVNEQAKLENLVRNPLFMQNTATHPAFYSDHGVVHVRDVAKQILRVLQTINGVLIPRRSEKKNGIILVWVRCCTGIFARYWHERSLHLWTCHASRICCTIDLRRLPG